MLHKIFDEQVETGVVCRRDRAPHQCLTLVTPLSARKRASSKSSSARPTRVPVTSTARTHFGNCGRETRPCQGNPVVEPIPKRPSSQRPGGGAGHHHR